MIAPVLTKRMRYHKLKTLYSILSSLCSLLVQSKLNWFEFCEKSENIVGQSEHILHMFFEKIRISQCGFEKHELVLIELSHDAYLASATKDYTQKRVQNAINGDIVTDSEPDNPNDYMNLTIRANAVNLSLQRNEQSSRGSQDACVLN